MADPLPTQWQSAKAEFNTWFYLALPAALTIMFNCSLTLTDASVLGHLSSDDIYPNATSTDFLAAVSLGYSWYYALNIFVFAGSSNAISVLSSRSFGAKNYLRAAQVYVVGITCSIFFCIPIGFGIYYTADVVRLILPATTTDLRYLLIQVFSRTMLFALPGQTLASCTSNFLNSANVVKAPLLIAIFQAVINLAFNICFVHGMPSLHIASYGFRGSPCATVATNLIGGIALFLYLLCGKGSKEHEYSKVFLWRFLSCCNCCSVRNRNQNDNTYNNHNNQNNDNSLICFDREIFSTYVGQALPLAIGGAFEEWQIQVVGFFAGALGPVSTATNNGMQQIFVTLSALNYGIMTATTIRVGYYLGEGKPNKSKSVTLIAFVTSLCVGSAIGLSLIVLRNQMGYLFSNDIRVVELSSTLCWIVGPTYVLLSVFFVSVATLQGQGRSTALAVCFLIGAWLVSVPLAWYLTFDLNLDLIGIWYGLVGGYSVIMILTCVAIYKSKWQELSNQAVKENEKPILKENETSNDEDLLNLRNERMLVEPLL